MKLGTHVWQTRVGLLKIFKNPDGWTIHLDDEWIGGKYPSAQHALDDVTGGHCFSHSSRVDTSTLGIPIDITDLLFEPHI